MEYPILYTFRRCPYAMRARMALAYSGIPYEHREIILKNKPAEMLVLSHKEKVPILHLTDKTVLDESMDIVLWALEHEDSEGWLDIDSNTHSKTDQLIQNCDGEFKDYLDRYKYSVRFPEATQKEYRTVAAQFLQQLETQLAQTNYLFSSKVTLADIAIFPFVRQFAYVDIDWFNQTPYKKLQGWLDSFKESELFLSIMGKFTPWQAADEAILVNIST